MIRAVWTPRSLWLWRSYAMDSGTRMGMSGMILVVTMVDSDGNNEDGNDEGGNYNGCTFGAGTGGDGVYQWCYG